MRKTERFSMYANPLLSSNNHSGEFNLEDLLIESPDEASVVVE